MDANSASSCWTRRFSARSFRIAASEWSDFVDCEVWHGDRPLTPDGLPLVGQLAPGLYINAGHGFNGWRDAGITASFVAGLVAGGEDDAPAYVEAWAPGRYNL